MTDNLVRGEIEELFEPAIGEEITAIRVFHIDHGGRVVDHILQELLVTAKRVLGAFSVGHALEGAGHTNGSSGIIPDGLAARAEPVIFSRLW